MPPSHTHKMQQRELTRNLPWLARQFS